MIFVLFRFILSLCCILYPIHQVTPVSSSALINQGIDTLYTEKLFETSTNMLRLELKYTKIFRKFISTEEFSKDILYSRNYSQRYQNKYFLVKINEEYLNYLRFATDIVRISRTLEELQNCLMNCTKNAKSRSKTQSKKTAKQRLCR